MRSLFPLSVLLAVTLSLSACLNLTGCAGWQQAASDSTAAAIASLDASIAKLPADSPERVKLEKARADLQKAADTGFDPVMLAATFFGNHPGVTYGAAGVAAVWAALKTLPWFAGMFSKVASSAPKLPS